MHHGTVHLVALEVCGIRGHMRKQHTGVKVSSAQEHMVSVLLMQASP